MKLTEFRNLLREEVRRIISENSITLSNGKVIKNTSVDNNGINLDSRKITIDDLSQGFSIKPNSKKAFLELLKASKTLLRLVIEKDLGITDDEGFNDTINRNKPLQAKYAQLVEPRANPYYWSLDMNKLPLSIKRSISKIKGKFKGDHPELTSFVNKYYDFSKYKVNKDYKWIISFYKQDSPAEIDIEFWNPKMKKDAQVVKFLKKFETD
jgi:hypothetical protein